MSPYKGESFCWTESTEQLGVFGFRWLARISPVCDIWSCSPLALRQRLVLVAFSRHFHIMLTSAFDHWSCRPDEPLQCGSEACIQGVFPLVVCQQKIRYLQHPPKMNRTQKDHQIIEPSHIICTHTKNSKVLAKRGLQ